MMRKIKLQQKTYPTLFPSLLDTLQLFDFPAGLAELVRFISKETDTQLPVDNKTLKKAEGEGVKRQKGITILKYVISNLNVFSESDSVTPSIFGLDFRRTMREFARHPGSGKEWAMSVPIFIKTTGLTWRHAEKFINLRLIAEKELYSFKGSRGDRVENVIRIYSECCFADSAELRKLFSSFLNQQQPTKAEIINKHKHTLGILLTDFYFWLLAYVELDIAELIAKEVELTEEEQATVDSGVFQHIMPKSEDERVVSSLHQLFDRWRLLYSRKILNKSKPISISEFATLLPDSILSNSKPGDMDDEQREQSKYRMLCAWRAGKKVPSDDKLEAFIENILPPCRERLMWFYYAKTAIAIDLLFKKASTEKVYNSGELVKIFNRYRDYHKEVRMRFALPSHPHSDCRIT
jgi:hypothetical protein